MDQNSGVVRSFLTHNLTIERVPTILAASSATLYILGFIVATSFFVSRGVNDPVLLSPRYVMAGALVAVTLLGYYFFVGRKLLKIAAGDFEISPDFGPVFRGFLLFYFLLELVAACCGVASWLGGFLISDISALPAQVALAAVYVVDDLLFQISISKRYPRTVFALSALAHLFAISLFYLFCTINTSLLYLFAEYLCFTIVGTMILASPAWRAGDKAHGIFFMSVVVLLGVINFGSTVYENISPKYGGAEPPRVEVLLAADASEELKGLLLAAKNNLYLLLESDSAMTIRLGREKESRSLRLDKKFVSGVVFMRHEPLKLNLPSSLEPLRTLIEKKST